MNNRRKLIVTLSMSAIAIPLSSFAQSQPTKVHRIGILSAETPSSLAGRMDALRAGLRDLGYVEGKNIVIEFRGAEGNYDRLPDLAVELARFKPDVIVTLGQKAAVAAKHATTTIPIVFPNVSDAVATGLVASLARPGANMTGSTFFGPELMAKQLELLREAVPRMAQVAVLQNPANSSSGPNLRAMEIAAKSLKLGLQHFDVRGPNEFESVFAAMAKRRIDAVVIQSDTMFFANAIAIADLPAKKRLPSAGNTEFAEAGGLIGYGVNILEMHRRAAVFVDKILKGAKPGDIPVERPTKFELVVNLKTAKALGLTIPPSIMVQATRVIE